MKTIFSNKDNLSSRTAPEGTKSTEKRAGLRGRKIKAVPELKPSEASFGEAPIPKEGISATSRSLTPQQGAKNAFAAEFTRQALMESLKNYQAILDEVEDCVGEVDLKGNITATNRAGMNIWGVAEKKDMLGVNFRSQNLDRCKGKSDWGE